MSRTYAAQPVMSCTGNVAGPPSGDHCRMPVTDIPAFVIASRLGESSRKPRTFVTPMRASCGAHSAGFQLEPHEGETLHGLAARSSAEHEAPVVAATRGTAVVRPVVAR